MKKHSGILIFILLPFALLAQHKNLPLNREFFYKPERELLTNDSLFHSGFKPLIESRTLPLQQYIRIHSRDTAGQAAGYLKRKLFRESFIIVNEPRTGFHLTIDPLFNLELGESPDDTAGYFYKNTRGLLVRGDIGKKFSFESSFYENQATFVDYIREYIDSLGVAPGQGRVKKFKSNGYDFAMSSGYISYSPSRHLNIQLGHGKHFVGDGYRSLLLSDNSFNYPFVRITTTFGRFQYTNLYTSFMNLTDGGVVTPAFTERLFQKKAGAFQYLSWDIANRVQLGLFQGMIWQAADNRNRQHLDVSYFNPIIFGSAIEYGLRKSNNVVLGSTLKARPFKTLYLYAQYMLDEIAEDFLKGSIHNKQGYQAGLEYLNAFTIKNLGIQAEFNRVRPYSYSHKKQEQSYSHYNQPLAHPLGANFSESVGIINYRAGQFFAEVRFSYATIGADSAARNFGSNIFLSNNTAFYGVSSTVNEQEQGLRSTLTHRNFHIGYLINPATNMNIAAGISVRELSNAFSEKRTAFYYIALRTSLRNIYYDF